MSLFELKFFFRFCISDIKLHVRTYVTRGKLKKHWPVCTGQKTDWMKIEIHFYPPKFIQMPISTYSTYQPELPLRNVEGAIHIFSNWCSCCITGQCNPLREKGCLPSSTYTSLDSHNWLVWLWLTEERAYAMPSIQGPLPVFGHISRPVRSMGFKHAI